MMLHEEAHKVTQLLQNKVLDTIWRHRKGEVVIQFVDGTRLFIDRTSDDLELSITEGVGIVEEDDPMRPEEAYFRVPVHAAGRGEPIYVKEQEEQEYKYD